MDNDVRGYVYRITNNLNKKYYIGSHKSEFRTKDDCLNDKYFGSGLALKRAIKKYGIFNFSKEILVIADNVRYMETLFLKFYDVKNDILSYNMHNSGFNPVLSGYCSPNSRAVVNSLGEIFFSVTEAKKYYPNCCIYECCEGRYLTAAGLMWQYINESKEEQSSREERKVLGDRHNSVSFKTKRSLYMKSNLNPMVSSALAREKISIRMRTHNPMSNADTAKKVSEKQIGRRRNLDSIRKQKDTLAKVGVHSSKSIICVETKIVYQSLSEAARNLNISVASLSMCLKGKRKTVGGFHWQSVDVSLENI